MTGFRSEESFRDGWLQAVPPEDRERVKTEWNRAVQDGVPWKAQFRLKTRNGRTTTATVLDLRHFREWFSLRIR